MEIMSRENEKAFSGLRPMDLSTLLPHAALQVLPAKQRTSSLEAPIMLLTGHPSAVYTIKFNPSGTLIASGSHDREIFLWRVHGGCKNYMVLKGHKNAILDLSLVLAVATKTST